MLIVNELGLNGGREEILQFCCHGVKCSIQSKKKSLELEPMRSSGHVPALC